MQTFDTLKQLKELQAFGFNEKQAEGIVHSLSAARDFDLSRLSTKDQVANLDKRIDYLEKRLDKLEEKFEGEFNKINKKMEQFVTKEHLTGALAEMQVNTLKWMIGIMFTFSGIIIAAMKFIH